MFLAGCHLAFQVLIHVGPPVQPVLTQQRGPVTLDYQEAKALLLSSVAHIYFDGAEDFDRLTHVAGVQLDIGCEQLGGLRVVLAKGCCGMYQC